MHTNDFTVLSATTSTPALKIINHGKQQLTLHEELCEEHDINTVVRQQLWKWKP